MKEWIFRGLVKCVNYVSAKLLKMVRNRYNFFVWVFCKIMKKDFHWNYQKLENLELL